MYRFWKIGKLGVDFFLSKTFADQALDVGGHVCREKRGCGAHYRHKTFYLQILTLYVSVEWSEMITSCTCFFPPMGHAEY